MDDLTSCRHHGELAGLWLDRLIKAAATYSAEAFKSHLRDKFGWPV